MNNLCNIIITIVLTKAAFTYSDFSAKSQQLCSKITTNKIARCEHHGKICSKKYSLAKSLQNRSNFATK